MVVAMDLGERTSKAFGVVVIVGVVGELPQTEHAHRAHGVQA